jgi:peptidoglycan/xylan/chitin deacetylase (PgdA/CDA1 family)
VAATPAARELVRRLPAPLRALAVWLAGGTFEPSAASASARGGTRVILMYHRVASVASDPLELCVSPEHFGEQLELLGSLGEIVPLEALVRDRPRRGGSTFALTFDDGYADNALAAAPLLAEHDAPATVFVVAGAVGSGRPFWWDRLSALVFGAGDVDDERRQAYWKDWERLRGLPAPRIEQELDSREREPEGAGAVHPDARPMSEAELASLADGPVAIGGHTVTHPSLPALPVAGRRDEIAKGRERLEALLNRPVETFAYPYGDHDADTVRLVRRSGFRLACTIHENRVSRFSSPFLLPRYAVRDWPAEELERRLAGWIGS